MWSLLDFYRYQGSRSCCVVLWNCRGDIITEMFRWDTKQKVSVVTIAIKILMSSADEITTFFLVFCFFIFVWGSWVTRENGKVSCQWQTLSPEAILITPIHRRGRAESTRVQSCKTLVLINTNRIGWSTSTIRSWLMRPILPKVFIISSQGSPNQAKWANFALFWIISSHFHP